MKNLFAPRLCAALLATTFNAFAAKGDVTEPGLTLRMPPSSVRIERIAGTRPDNLESEWQITAAQPGWIWLTVDGEKIGQQMLLNPDDGLYRGGVLLRLKNQFGLMMSITSKVPDGHSLHIRTTGTESSAMHASLRRSYSKYGDDGHCSWMWTDMGFRSELSETAAKQTAVLFAQGPLLVTNGQPRTGFSVTNAAGKVYAGQFELRGPPITK